MGRKRSKARPGQTAFLPSMTLDVRADGCERDWALIKSIVGMTPPFTGPLPIRLLTRQPPHLADALHPAATQQTELVVLLPLGSRDQSKDD